MSAGAVRLHILRLLGLPPAAALPDAELDAAAAAQAERVATGLVDEAFANDDVVDSASARVFVAERLAECAGRLSLTTRTRIDALATQVIAERAPEN